MSTRGIIIPVDVSASIAGMIGKTGNNTAGEDSPSNPSPARIVDIRNVMPTEDGYFSAFAPIALNVDRYTHVDPHPFKYTEFAEDQNTRSLAALKMARTQQVIPYETAAGVRVYVILAETGIFVRNHMVRIGEHVAEPEKVVGPADVVEAISPEEGVFNLWTTSLIDGNLYCYLQGKEEVYVIGDLGTHLSMETLGTEHRIVRKWESDILQVVAAKPSFLNMSGQVGIFRAGNRLGFWDSDNSIAWSSAFDKMDFTPDVTSLAGATKFAALTGAIISILPTTRGFLVYATSSVLNAVPSGSEELWAADLVLAETGIEYYFQATTGSNPDQHFAWTKTGLYRIQGGKAEKILEDDYRALRATLGNGTEALYRLTAIDDTYLVISRASYWEERPAKSDFVIGNIKGNGKDYPFYLPSPNRINPTWQDVLSGRFPGVDDPNFGDEFELEDLDMPSLDEGKPLIPFWTGYAYYSPPLFDSRTYSAKESTAVPFPVFSSHVFPEVTLTRDENMYIQTDTTCIAEPNTVMVDTFVTNRFTSIPHNWSARQKYYDLDKKNRFFDKAGQEFSDIFEGAMLRYQTDMNLVWETLQWTGYMTAGRSCDMFMGTVGDFHINGWRAVGVTEDTATTEDYEFPKLSEDGEIPPMAELVVREVEEGVFEEFLEMSEEAYEYYKHFLGTEDLPYASQQRFNYGSVVASPIPVKDIPIRWLIDSCSIGAFAFVDDVVAVDIAWADLIPREEATRPGVWECHSHQQFPGCTIISVANRRVIYECVDSNGIITYMNKPEWEVCTSQSCTIPEPLPYGAIGIVDTPEGSCSWDSKKPDSENAIVKYSFAMLAKRYRAFIPRSFRGKTLEEINKLLDIKRRRLNPEKWQPIFEAENAGYGYENRISSSITRYVKTITRGQIWMQNEDGECYPKGPAISFSAIPDNFEYEETILNFDNGGEYTDSDWPWGKYPEDITAGDGYPDLPEWEWPVDVAYGATYRRGTRMPYYPIYEKAWVLDMPLVKWGSMDWPHSCIFSTNPVNGMGSSIIANKLIGEDSVDYVMPFGIVPKFATPKDGYREYPRRWDYLLERFYSNEFGQVPPELLIQHGLPVLLNRGGTGGRMTFRTTALTRDGHTKLVGISGNGITKATMEILGSFHGETFGSVMPLSAYTSLPMHFSKAQSRVISWDLDPFTSGGREFQDFRAPFVLIGKEFQITLAGHFSLQKLICYGQPTGSIRFYPSQTIPW